MQQAILSKWGNSVGVRIPKAILSSAGLKEGDTLQIESCEQAVILRRTRNIKKFSLEDTLDVFHTVDEHGEPDWGAPVGREVW